MNHDNDPFSNDACEREWLAQELALREERLGLDPAGDDARVQRYRVLARALRQPLHNALPADFAQLVAARATAGSARKRTHEISLEAGLTIALMSVFVLAVGVVATLYGKEWLPSIAAILPVNNPTAMRWLLALAGCIGLSWLPAQWHTHARERPLA